MSSFAFSNDNIPLLHGATGKFEGNVDVPTLASPLPVSATAIATASFSASGNAAIGNDVSVGLTASTSVTLAALFKEQTGADPSLVTDFELTPALGDDNLLLALDLGGKADISAQGSYTYSVLTVGGTLQAGADARLVNVRSYPRTDSAQTVLTDFFGNLALPGTIATPPPAGQVTSLEFGGYLKFGVNASAGYQLKGTHDFQKISGLKLSESYALSVTGKLSVNAQLAGRFSVEVRAADDDHWARVMVKRQRSKDLQIAADLNVGAQVDTQGLPATGKEFLGALLGVRAKNWINQADSILQQAAAIKTPKDLTDKLDGLAGTYISRYVNKAVNDFLPADIKNLMTKLQTVVDSYNNAGDSAVALFDRYFDVAVSKLLPILKQVEGFANWDQFQGEIDPMIWNVVQQLTGGNVLDFILQKTLGLTNLQAAAQKAASLITDPVHQEIRDFIAVAKKDLDLDQIVGQIAAVDTPAGLATKLSDVAQGVVQRIIGTAVGKISNDDFKALTGFIQKVQSGEASFFKKFDEILQAAASQSFTMDIGLAYASSDEHTALIDVDIRLLNDDAGRTPCTKGQGFMRSAGLGNFSEILAKYDPSVVRLRQGNLTHNFSSSHGLTINIAGWHNNFQYSDMHKVVTQSDQQISSTPAGMLNVFTTVEMSATHDRVRKMNQHEQEMHSNFTLRFLAQTHSTVDDPKFNKRDQDYLLDVITGQAATYSSTLSDSNTTPAKLNNLLAFAAELGLDQKGATQTALAPVLKLTGGNFGPVSANYQVQFSKQGLDSLFKKGTPDVTEGQIRTILRRIVMSNYAGNTGLAPVAWLYCSDKVRLLAADDPINFVTAGTILQNVLSDGVVFTVPVFAGTQPANLNQPINRQLVGTLFSMERGLIAAFLGLQKLVKQESIELADLEKSSNAFGSALNSFESQTQLSGSTTSPTFAVFDGLIQLATPGSQARDSALSLQIGPAGATHQLLFQLSSTPAALTAGAGGD
jgi:hypothetical protein